MNKNLIILSVYVLLTIYHFSKPSGKKNSRLAGKVSIEAVVAYNK